ncbi:MAG: SMI1/KNR4 family protein [Zavarzinella sp.]
MKNKITESKEPLTVEAIELFERAIETRLPSDYKEFLLLSNGGRPERTRFAVEGWPGEFGDVHFFWSINFASQGSLEWWFRELADPLIQNNLLAIGVDLGGNFITIGTSETNFGEIWYWDPTYDYIELTEGKMFYYLSKNIFDFVENLESDE